MLNTRFIIGGDILNGIRRSQKISSITGYNYTLIKTRTNYKSNNFAVILLKSYEVNC
jgi:hypothetical protein